MEYKGSLTIIRCVTSGTGQDDLPGDQSPSAEYRMIPSKCVINIHGGTAAFTLVYWEVFDDTVDDGEDWAEKNQSKFTKLHVLNFPFDIDIISELAAVCIGDFCFIFVSR